MDDNWRPTLVSGDQEKWRYCTTIRSYSGDIPVNSSPDIGLKKMVGTSNLLVPEMALQSVVKTLVEWQNVYDSHQDWEVSEILQWKNMTFV